MFNKNMLLLDDINTINEFDTESIPFLKSDSFNFDKGDLLLPFNPSQFHNINQEIINFEGIKNIVEDDSEKSIKIDYNLNQIDIQSTVSTKLFSSLKDKIIAENQEKMSINNESKASFKVKLYHKRGRKKSDKNTSNQKCHLSDDFDNILRKIQVSYINFLINLSNDALKTVFGIKTTYKFKDINYKLKKQINHNYIENLKKSLFGDILQMDISPKNKIFQEDMNKITYSKVCEQSEELKKLFEKNYLYMIKKYFNFVDDGNHVIDIDGFKIALSPKTETFSNLLKKNKEKKNKFKEVAQTVYSLEIEQDGKKFLINKKI
jgi:hypothetical protein